MIRCLCQGQHSLPAGHINLYITDAKVLAQRTGTNCLGIVQKNSWGTVKNFVNWCHMLANINIGGSITAAGIAAIHYRQVLQYPRAASALALAYRSININHNKRPRPTGFWQCLPHSLPVWPGYVRMLCPLCPLFSATVSFLMDASQRSRSSSNSSSWLSI